MTDVIPTTDGGEPRGSGMLGIIIGVLIVLALLVGGWWLFMREPVDDADTTIIEQEAPVPADETDVNIEGDTNVVVPDTGGSVEESPSP